MNKEKSPLQEVAQSVDALKTARSEPLVQEQPRTNSMDFIRSFVLGVPVQTQVETKVTENMNIEKALEAQLEAEVRKMEKSNSDPADKVTFDIPLLIRLFEYAREDAKTDMDLHNVTERIIALSKENPVLTMEHYEQIVKDSVGGNKDYPNPAFAGEPQAESIDFLKKLAGIR